LFGCERCHAAGNYIWSAAAMPPLYES
jgi:hypothetical protein